jgi:hypothetical protein
MDPASFIQQFGIGLLETGDTDAERSLIGYLPSISNFFFVPSIT